jgi:hypothetical protein
MEDCDYLPLNIGANSDCPTAGFPPFMSNGTSALASRARRD